MKSYRIFLVIGGKATPTDNNKMWVKNLYDPLIALGHDVFLLDIDTYAEQYALPYMSPEAKERISNDLPVIFKKEQARKPFDIFFSYLHDGQIFPSVLKEIKQVVYTINYSTNFHQFEMYKEVASIVDQNIYISSIGKSGFDGLGVKSYWMPLAANPEFYKPSPVKNDHSVFVGSAYGPRPSLFWRLFQYGIDLQLYGNEWKGKQEESETNDSVLKKEINSLLQHITGYELRKPPKGGNLSLEDKLRSQYQAMNETIIALIRKDYGKHLHPSLNDKSYVQVLAEAGIVINIQESRFNSDYLNHRVLYGSNLRDYEATMCGTFVCTQYSEEITELFEVGKEIICYHNEHDLAEKIKYFTAHTTERDRIARAGYEKSLHSHTWQNRFTDFFNYLKL